jgi:hypothetical protein
VETPLAQDVSIASRRWTAPGAAAVAGIVFSVLLITSLVLIRISIPDDPLEAGDWLAGRWRGVSLALNLLPFAGIAFLWFIGVVRDRLGNNEDRFFATVFLGSGLLYLAMLFTSAAASVVFPLWMLLISMYILLANLRGAKREPLAADTQ